MEYFPRRTHGHPQTPRVICESRRRKKGGAKTQYADGAGLFLQVQVSSAGGCARSWVLRYTLRGSGGKFREAGLRGIDDVPMSEAREEAAKWRKMALSIGDVSSGRANYQRYNCGTKGLNNLY